MKYNVINLDNDQVFKHSIEYKDEVDYTGRMIKQHDQRINTDEREIPCGRCEGSDLRPRHP